MDITKPTLILDKSKCLDNIAFMNEKAKNHQLHFRPHFKTHQSAAIGEWFRQQGITAITVSSVSMAEYFANNGWENITIAFPVNILEVDKINLLASSIELNLIIDNIHTLQFLMEHLTSQVGLFIEIDTGHHRSGVNWDNFSFSDELLKSLSTSPKIQFVGFLTHSGHSYAAKSKNEIISIHNDTLKKTGIIKERYKKDFPSLIISIGDTPSCSVCNDFSSVDEIRPGNFIFYDVMQYYIGSCTLDQIAVSVACPIVSINNLRNEFVVYCGAIHLSKESISDQNGKNIFGLVVEYNEIGWGKPITDTYISSLSQEHGIIKTTPEFLSKIKTGKIIGILPVHSCLTVFQLKKYLTTSGEDIDIKN